MKNSNQDDAVVRMLNQVEGLLKKERDTLRSGKPEAKPEAPDDADWPEADGWDESGAKGPTPASKGTSPEVVAIEDAPTPRNDATPPSPSIAETVTRTPEPVATSATPVEAPIESPEPTIAPGPVGKMEPNADTTAPPTPSSPQPLPDATPGSAPGAADDEGADDDDAYTGRRLTTRLGQLLLDGNLISEGDLEKALAEQRESGDRLGGILVSGGYVGEAELLAVLVKQHGVPAADLDNAQIEPEVAELIPAEMARRYLVVPLAVRHGAIDLAMVDPTDFVALAHLRFATGMRPNVFITTVTGAERAIARLYGTPVTAAKGGDQEPMPDNPHEAVKKMILDRDAMLMGAESDPRKFYQLAASIDEFIEKIFRIASGA